MSRSKRRKTHPAPNTSKKAKNKTATESETQVRLMSQALGPRPGMDPKHSDFMRWATDRGVQIGSIAPIELLGRGVGLRTTAFVATGSLVISVPKQAMFVSDRILLEANSCLTTLSPQARLTVSALANRENLQRWIATWPSRKDIEQCMPLCWSPMLREGLPQSATRSLARMETDFAEDWAASEEWCTRNECSYRDYRYFWLIVNSRSFHWRPEVTRGGGEYALCPFVDYMNHGPTGTGCKVSQTASGYEVWASRDYRKLMVDAPPLQEPGEEVLATYGAHSNDSLLVHYGFVPECDVDDSISLDQAILAAIPQTIRNQLEDSGYLGQYFLTPSDNSICYRTEVAVRATLLASQEWEHFVSNGEDLSGDATPRVRKWLCPLFREEADAAERRALEALDVVSESADVEGEEEVVARRMVKERWSQIAKALREWANATEAS